MKTEPLHPVLIQGGEWNFSQEGDGKWRWSVSFNEQRITSPRSFQKRVDMVDDARKHGYGHAPLNSDEIDS